MDTSVSKQLIDKMYEKRKAAALELEKQVRECYHQGDHRRISQIVDQLVDMFSNSSNPLHVRNGGLIGLAGTAIALGVDIAPYMEKFVEPLLVCFTDPESRVRYFSAECLYNIAKVSKGEILVYFNPIFDALSKLSADSELSVKNGAELLDRLLKDIVAETASVYIPHYPETEKIRKRFEESLGAGILVPHPDDIANGEDMNTARKAFSLAHFIPLLSDRIYVHNPFTRSYLVSWITVLDSVPELELITYLPEFLDGLLKYLSDPTEDVRVATEALLGDFLDEIKRITKVQSQTKGKASERVQPTEDGKDHSTDLTTTTAANSDQGSFLPESDGGLFDGSSQASPNEKLYDQDGHWLPGQGVKIHYAAIVEVMLQQLDEPHDVVQQSLALRWLSEFLKIVQDVMLPFTPRLIEMILPNLAHDVASIQAAATHTNSRLKDVIQSLPTPIEPSSRQGTDKASSIVSPAATGSSTAVIPSAGAKDAVPGRDISSSESPPEAGAVSTTSVKTPTTSAQRGRKASIQMEPIRGNTVAVPAETGRTSCPGSPTSMSGTQLQQSPEASILQEKPDQIDYVATVNALTRQFVSEYEETRVAALEWLIMLHQKAPKKILGTDDDTFFVLLKTLSDSSEKVIKNDLLLIAQISSTSDEGYFKRFMHNLLQLFSTDRGLLETRGSLIIQQLCVNLNTERIYRTSAELLEKEEDLEFASGMVQKLNMILITSPELADFRRRLKSLETRQDGQALFITLYRSWCHNPVAAFSLCLLAQAYEHASNLLYIFADLEITVQLLVQIDKLVQLIESPVFTYLRLQLLEPDKHPHLFKCLYGLLMLLPQSSAFVSLRNRLSAVNLYTAPRSDHSNIGNISSTRSKLGREDIKWQELLSHFRSVQARHEKARRQGMGTDSIQFARFAVEDQPVPLPSSTVPVPQQAARPGMRRKMTGDVPMRPPSRSGALSPLNPIRARGQTGMLASTLAQHSPASPTFNQSQARQQSRIASVSKKTGQS
ncbi:ARM repeat-containing protein [Wolfiporia cocos MD-104 SS10]|uniref:ARM repeat-containing protein n=1 Tax=Wolfiporia cocos (strain MD-104) TaxID=742152 RepID=A0A2H3JG06_WOLCO|nr:ARM repeat-containing protein [Wolfiporia cocos MD-104 SS10]